MNILLISRDKKFIARIRRCYNYGVNKVMVIPTVGWYFKKSHVMEVPDLVLFDITGLKPEVWPKYVANLRKIFDLKVVVVDGRANWRNATTAFTNYAVRYMSKAGRTTDATIEYTITSAFRSALPLLPCER